MRRSARHVPRDLLLRILASEEEHKGFLDRRFDPIKQIGIERHIQPDSAPATGQGEDAAEGAKKG